MSVLRYNIIVMGYYFDNSKRTLMRCLQVVLVFLGLTSLLAAQSYVYWVNRSASSIQRSELDGSNVTTMVTGLSSPRNIAYDPVGNKIYWVERGTGKIQRSNIDGSSIEDVVTGIGGGLRELAIDNANSHVYWADDVDGIGGSAIRRANLDGSNIVTLVSGLVDAQGIALDVPGDRLYFSEEDALQISRTTLAGSGLTSAFTVSSVEDIALSADQSTLYWVERNGSVYSGNTSTSGTTQLASGYSVLSGIAISTDFIFFADFNAGSVHRIDIGGGGATTLASGLGALGGMAFVPEPSTYGLIAGSIALVAAWAWRRWRMCKADSTS